MRPPPSDRGQRASKRHIYVEDVLIFLAVGALFVLGVFFRNTLWGQIGLGITLLVMIVVFVRRFRRVHREFTGRGGPR